METTIALEQMADMPLDEFLRMVLKKNRLFKVTMPNGDVVVIQPEVELAALPELDGYVPENWKEAIYAQ